MNSKRNEVSMIFQDVEENVRVYEAKAIKEMPVGLVEIKDISAGSEAKSAPVISVEEMRRADAYTIANFVPGKELMYRAAYGVFLAIKNYGPLSRKSFSEDSLSDARESTFSTDSSGCDKVAIVAGSGNNGGDGYALAQILNEHGADVTIFRVSEKLSEDGAYYLDFCRKAGISEVMMPAVAESAGCSVCGDLPDESAAGHGDDSAFCGAANDASTAATRSDTPEAARLGDISGTTPCSDARGILSGFDIIVDCILGTGFSGVPRKSVAEAIVDINSTWESHTADSESFITAPDPEHDSIAVSAAYSSGEMPAVLCFGNEKEMAAKLRPYIVSVDINSGLNGDTGEAALAVKSDLTVSIGYIKHGQLTENAAKYTGKLVCADIGILLERT